MAPLAKYTAPKHNAMADRGPPLFNKGLDRRSKSGLYFLSWFVSKEEFFTNP